MSSKSSSDEGRGPLPVGRIAGFRGTRGELTVRVPSGVAERWTALRRVWVGKPGGALEPDPRDIEASRAYRDRLVLKLRGVENASEAEKLVGFWVFADGRDVPRLPEGTYYVARLVGLEVVDEKAGRLGRVEDVIETGGVDLLVVRRDGGAEVLVPLARSIVLAVDEDEGSIRVRLPEGLLTTETPS